MLAIGVSETITDGTRLYVLGHDLKFHYVGNVVNDADHHVTKEGMDMLLKTNGAD